MALPYMLADGPSRKLGPKALTAWWTGIMVGGMPGAEGAVGREGKGARQRAGTKVNVAGCLRAEGGGGVLGAQGAHLLVGGHHGE